MYENGCIRFMPCIFIGSSACFRETLTFLDSVTEATKPTEVPDYEERNSLEDVLFGDEENFIESDEKRNFFIALRLSPFPEHLVKGYEFKMLNK